VADAPAWVIGGGQIYAATIGAEYRFLTYERGSL
jgi:hypothetical protein